MQASMVRPQITENPELRAVQENQEYGPLWKTLDWVGLVLNEIDRPLRSIIAGGDSWKRGATMAQAWDVVKDEFTWGLGTGNLKRDISAGSLFYKEGSLAGSPDLLSGAGLGGLAIEAVADPANLIPFGKIAKGLGWLASPVARGVGRGISSVPVIGPQKDAFVKGFTKMFFRPQAETAAGKAGLEAVSSINSFVAEHSEVLLHNHALDNKAWRKLAEETNMTPQQFNEFIVEQMRNIKASDPNLLPEALNDTFARVYNEYGIEGFDDYMKNAGLRALKDERELRRGIVNANFQRANSALTRELGQDVTNDIANVLFELKERDLE
ncbi:MAG: hypothetical protein ACYTFQ_28795, partial [Planctomycetota bacterium]